MSTRAHRDLSADVVTLGPGASRFTAIFAATGAVGLVAAAGLGAATGWDGFFRSYLTSFVYFLSLALGALFFVLVSFVTRAGWSVTVRRLAEGIAPNLVVPMLPLVVPILFGMGSLYPWTHPEVVRGDHLLEAKATWLSTPFFLVRTSLYFLVWGIFSTWFHRFSTGQDRRPDAGTTKRLEALSTAGLILFAFSVTFFAFDYVMSLTPHWYSTIFGVYFFAGCVLGFFALLSVASYAVQGAGRLKHAITVEHYHDLGKLVFAFIVFWAYIGISQYLLMWYANLPEETVWYQVRQSNGWGAVSALLIFGHFVVPFLALLSRNVKRRVPLLIGGASFMLFMHYVDAFWLTRPAVSPGSVPLSLMDVATFVGIGGLFLAAATRRLAAHALVPVNDPRLHEALRFENY